MIRRVGLALAGVCLAVGVYWFCGRADAKRTFLVDHATEIPSAWVSEANTQKDKASPKVLPATGSVFGVTANRAPRKRPWDVAYLSSLGSLGPGDPIRFELVAGALAFGKVQHLLRTNNELIYVSGDLQQPESGQFFFQKQTIAGVAGAFVGIITFPASEKAYRLEPSGIGGAPELVERPLQQVMCRHWPVAANLSTNPTAEIPPLNPGNFPSLPIPGYQNGIAVLESLHGAKAVIYLDFQGGYTPSWGGVSYERPNVSNAQIRDVWVRVAEDFMPFNINVTTDLVVYQNAPANSRQRVIITPTTTVAGEAGGVAFIGSFNWTGDIPCWVFTLSGKGCAEACSHELGHTLGLTHEGQEYGGQLYEYYFGQGAGDTSWAPIMGVPYYANVTQWCKGEYINPDNLLDELAIITTQNNNVSYRVDDTGDTLATSRYLELYPDYSAWAEGVIERTDDTDAFQFSTSGGEVSLRADPVSASPDLAVQVSLYDQDDKLVASNDPQDTLWASLSTNLLAGTYTFRVSGAGRNNPLTNGFSSYASLGYYSITGWVANARLPTRLSVNEHATNGTVVGIIPVSITNNDVFTFRITSGNTSNTFALDGSGILTVANNTLLDYDVLASKTQLAVQFELLVDILDTTEPSLSETNRRVVVAVTYMPTPPFSHQRAAESVVPAGTDVSYNINASGDLPLSYQWLHNGRPIAGAIATALSLTNVQAPDIGAYQVIITNALGSLTNLVANLLVAPAPPFIDVPPQPAGVSLGFPASFSVGAKGSEPLSYQWQLDGTNIDGATDAVLVLSNTAPQAAGSYQVVVSNALGSSISAGALLKIVPIAAWGWNAYGQTDLFIDLTNVVQISAGPTYNLALRRDGSVFAWGNTNQSHVPPNLTNAVAISGGGAHSLALRNNGTVAAWGANDLGQANVPLGLNNVVAIAAGGSHSLALTSAGTVTAWGRNLEGQIFVPFRLTNIVAIAAGSNHSLALGSNGKVVAWGASNSGQTRVPTNLSEVVSIAAGAWHNLALKRDGTVTAWGDNTNGQCAVPPGLSNVVAIAAGSFHSLALTKAGSIVAWGAGLTNAGYYPQFGQSTVPEPVRTWSVSAIAGGAAHTLALASEAAPFITQSPVGSFTYGGQEVILRAGATGAGPLDFQWQLNGTNIIGETNQVLIIPYVLANSGGGYRLVVSNTFGVTTSSVATVTVQKVAPIITLQPSDQTPFLGGSFSLQVEAFGSLPFYYQWRYNGTNIPGAKRQTFALQNLRQDQSGYYSVLVSNAFGVVSSAKAKVSVMQVVAWGKGTNFDFAYSAGQSIVPPGLTKIVRLAGGGYHSLAIEDIGRVIAWGAGTNGSGVLSRFYFGQTVVPSSLPDAVAVAGGLYHSVALGADGTVWAWGGSAGQAVIPNSLTNVVDVAAGNYHTAALQRNGQVVLWASPANLFVTTPPASASNLVAISALGNQTMGLRGDGTVVVWGGAAAPPVWLSEVVAVACGVSHCVALKSDGTVVCWGGASTPPGLSNVIQIAAGSGFSMALKNDGTVVTWGDAAQQFGVSQVPIGLSNVMTIACGYYHCLAALGDGSLAINAQPVSRLVAPGAGTLLRVVATGAQPLSYQWRFNGADQADATNSFLRINSVQDTNAGFYEVVVTNLYSSLTSEVATVSLIGNAGPPPVPLDQALRGAGLAWNTSSPAPWFGQNVVTFDGFPTAQSGHIADNQQSWVQTSVFGPGTLSFWWKVSSEQFFDYLNFYFDTIPLTGISGEVDWQSNNFTISSGLHTLRWAYEKDPSNSAGLDSGWLAQVSFIPDLPIIISQPVGQTTSMGATIVLTAEALGAAPLTFQWLKDGMALTGANEPFFVITNATRRDSGFYQMVASNANGSATSVFASIVVRVPQKLALPAFLPGSGFRLLSGDADGGLLWPSDLPGLQAQVSTNLVDWAVLSNGLELSNGLLLLSDPQSTNDTSRFYRILEFGH